MGPRSISSSPLERPSILIVEDSKTDEFLIRDALTTARVEAQVHVVRDGEKATDFFDAADADDGMPCPDLVLLDMNLPRKNGDEVIGHLRASARCRNAKVLVVSSSDQPRDRSGVVDFCIAGYFRKPTDYGEFMKLGPIVKGLLEGASYAPRQASK